MKHFMKSGLYISYYLILNLVLKKMKRSTRRQRYRGIREGYRSGLEERIASQLKASGVSYSYEKERLKYIPVPKHYTPDFILVGKNKKIYIETKGRFLAKDRTKHILDKEHHPDIDLRFIFTNSRQKLYKGSSTTYGRWCEKHGFIYAERSVPDSWLREIRKG